jgi:hypothetical protein
MKIVLDPEINPDIKDHIRKMYGSKIKFRGWPKVINEALLKKLGDSFTATRYFSGVVPRVDELLMITSVHGVSMMYTVIAIGYKYDTAVKAGVVIVYANAEPTVLG